MHTVLIVDPEPDDVATLRSMLDGEGYRFVAAATGAVARELVRSGEVAPAAVLLDWVLPGADGMSLLAWFKESPDLADVEIIVHSAEFNADDVRAGIEAGAYYYLTKPFEETQLEAIMRAAIRSYDLKRSLARKARAAEDAFGLLDIGRFRFRSIEEADLMAVHTASASGVPDAAMGLRELLVNAVEHGNLGITYAEKSALIADARLHDERGRRLEAAEYRNRRVEVTLHRLPCWMEVTIQDEGSGFDFRKYMKMDEARLFDAHGRGVLMASIELDLEYFEPGNHVRVRLPVKTR